MKHLLACLTVIVYMNSGKVLTYPNADHCRTTGGDSPLFGADSPDTVLLVLQDYEVPDSFFNKRERLVASFNLRVVERWEIK